MILSLLKFESRPPTDIPAKWGDFRNHLRSKRWKTSLKGTGVFTRIPGDRCIGCHGYDHPHGLCPFPLIKGWLGPGPSQQGTVNKQALLQQQQQQRNTRGREPPRKNQQGRGSRRDDYDDDEDDFVQGSSNGPPRRSHAYRAQSPRDDWRGRGRGGRGGRKGQGGRYYYD